MEAELVSHRRKWEESVVTAEQQRGLIEELTVKQAQLDEEVAKREKRVDELEALLAQVSDTYLLLCVTIKDG